MKDNVTIGQLIAKKRKEKQLTQTQLAVMLGVSHQAVSKWESGQALPDIGTMLELTRLYGCTVEELVGDAEAAQQEAPEAAQATNEDKENTDMKMKFTELMQMAAFMSKEAVGEIALKIEEKLNSWELAKLAPFVKQEVLEELIEKHQPELTWDVLRRLAPFMAKETVDRLAREISEGKRDIHPTQSEIDKTLDDIGKTFDEIGKGVGKALDDFGKGVGDTVQRVLRFGGNMFNDVSAVITDLANDIAAETEPKNRSERGAAIRRKAFERALADGRFDWIASHLSEIEDDTELKSKIAAEANRREMHDWVCAHMGGFADEQTIRAAIEAGNWDFLGDNVWQFDEAMQEETALAAMKAENWQWLGRYSDTLNLTNAAPEIARAAMKAGAKLLAKQICETHMDTEAIEAFAGELIEAGEWEGLALITDGLGEEAQKNAMIAMARAGEWAQVEACVGSADEEMKETLMEIAVEEGNFDAVDMLDRYI